ncbi:3808_t:CDS:1, partial [Scutellospora calospora]
ADNTAGHSTTSATKTSFLSYSSIVRGHTSKNSELFNLLQQEETDDWLMDIDNAIQAKVKD